MIDYHTHIGQFYDFYTSPSELIHTMDSVGVERFACSSTTICEGNYDKVLMEMSELQMSAGHRLLPVLWIVPQMLSIKSCKLVSSVSIRTFTVEIPS